MGGLSYGNLVEVDGEEAFFSLDTDQVIEAELEEIKEVYEENVEKMEEEMLEAAPTAATASLLSDTVIVKNAAVTNGYDTRYVKGADHNHLIQDKPAIVNYNCSAYAGVNIMRYWAKARGFTKLYYGNDNWMVNSMRACMKTDSGGTNPLNILPGLKKFSTEIRGQAYSGAASAPGLNYGYTYAKTLINGDLPFIISVTGGQIPGTDGAYTDAKSHSFTCFGWSELYSGGRITNSYYIINNGWDDVWRWCLKDKISVINLIDCIAYK